MAVTFDPTLAKLCVAYAIQHGLPTDTPSSQAFLKYWLRHKPNATEDRYGNFVYTDEKGRPARYHFAPKVLQRQAQIDHGYRKEWYNRSSGTYLAKALAVLFNASEALGSEGADVHQAVAAVMDKREGAKADRERLRDEKERIQQARLWAGKRVAWEHWDRFYDHVTGVKPLLMDGDGKEFEELIKVYQDDFLEKGIPTASDGATRPADAYASVAKPPLPVFKSKEFRYVWAEGMCESAFSVRVAQDPRLPDYVNVRLGSGGAAIDVLPASGKIEMNTDERLMGDGALGGCCIRRGAGEITATLMFFFPSNPTSAHDLLALWCQLLKGWRVPFFYLEPRGENDKAYPVLQDLLEEEFIQHLPESSYDRSIKVTL